jgi:hypothetical protein
MILLRKRIEISRCNVIYVQQGVVEGKNNRLGGIIGFAEKLVIIHELVKKI